MYTNKTINSNNSNATHLNYSSTSAPITIPHSTNSRFYIHNPRGNEHRRFINLDLGHTISNESAQDAIYATIESPPQRVGSSTFYIDIDSGSYETVSSIPSESDDEDGLYETIEETPPSLPPRNRSLGSSDIHFDTNPIYSSADNHIYATVRPKLPSRNKNEAVMDENPCYQSVETSPDVPPRGLQFHTRFRDEMRAADEAFRAKFA